MDVLFLDMDNTICENTTPDNIEFYPGLYLNKRPIQIVINAIFQLYPNVPIVILSKAQGGEQGIAEKHQWLYDHFPVHQIVDYIFLTDEPYYMKGVYLDKWLTIHNIPHNKALVVDDSKQVLQYCKAYGVHVAYPQQLICDYEQFTNTFHKTI